MFRRSIRTNILGIFLVIVGIVAISLLTSQYYFNQSLALQSTHKTFKMISNNISEEIASNERELKHILEANTENSKLYKEITFDYKHPALESLIQIMSINHNIYSLYFAHKNGRFYEVINMDESPLLYDTYQAPENTRWIVLIHINNEVRYTFLDEAEKILGTSIKKKKYNPLSRPWYKAAINSKQVIMTEPYLFTNLKKSGTTYAVELQHKGTVFAVDYTMRRLNHFLNLQKFEQNSEIFLFNHNGNKLASSDHIMQMSKQSESTVESKIDFTQEEMEYIKNAPPVIISNEKDWVPFDFQSAGVPMGYSVDILKLLSKKSGLKIQFVNGLTWTEIINNFKNKDIDIVQSIYKTPKREEFGSFSDPIYHFKNYFITNQHTTDVHSLRDLNYKRVGVVEGWAIEDLIKEKYPKIQLKRYDDLTSSILALSRDDIDAIIETNEAFRFLSNQLYIKNLTIGEWCKEYDNYKQRAIYLMLQKDDPILLSIINKSLRAITPKEKVLLIHKWLSPKSDANAMIDPQMMDAFIKKNNEVISYDLDQKNYFAMYIPLNEKLYLGIKIDSAPLFQPYKTNMFYSFIIAFILLIFSLPIIIYATRIIIQPIKDLIVENEHIKHRRFSKVKAIDTNIIEFIELSNSLVSMSQSINEYQKSQEALLDSVVKLIADAIDAKSPYTGGHCKRVPVIAQMLVDKANESQDGIFKDFKLTTEDELREFELGAWLHDCGKVTTPEYVVDKATKLETIYNRIHEIRTRFEVLWRDAHIRYLEARLNNEEEKQLLEQLNKEQAQLIDDFAFIASVNIGGEYMSQEKQQRVKEISQREWIRHFDDSLGLGEEESLRYDQSKTQTLPVKEKLLSDKQEHIIKRENFDYDAYRKSGFKLEVPEHLYNHGEIYNLCIEKGTLSDEERYKINEHVIMTIKMLEDIPFPEQLTKIPEYAGTHHETLIGDGYPKQLVKEDLSIPARIMAIADIFEALTASDRPYKKAKTLSESIKILSFMVKDEHIDEDIFKLFLESDLHNIYARQYLDPEQIDDVNIKDYL
ncbi:HD domain-containing phosphohydrolase [Sulfurimonas microaerophilic]|uniref:HD domain-containing phosphohydrolase n=1 Tax=Sulfurimonas microaerophilic TaxID=3058392 RepID=UPI0027149F58|nr:HD domain-containing phosphohydrolase [Sulfurimonas sp. hsl 1-7]